MTLVITQSGAGSGSGPLNFNQIVIDNQHATASGFDEFGFQTGYAAGLNVTINEGGSVTGFQIGSYVRLNHTVADSDITYADHIAGVFIANSSKDANGHGLYSINAVAAAQNGAAHGHIVGVNAEVGKASGADVDFVAGFRSQKYNTGHGALSDAAYTIFKSDSGEGWSTGILLNEYISSQSIASTGSIMASYNALTVANAFKLNNVTITGDLLLTPNYRFTGAGGVSIGHAGLTPAGSISGTGNAIFNGVFGSGGAGVGNGQIILGGNTSGGVTQTVQAAAGSPQVVWGTSSGTPAVVASAPLAIDAATGNVSIANTAWTIYTPTVTAGNGQAWGSGNIATGFYKQFGKTVFLRVSYAVGAAGVGGAGTSIIFSLPSGMTGFAGPQFVTGGESGNTGKTMRGYIASGATTLQGKYYDNTFTPSNNDAYTFQGVIEIQ